MDAHLIISLAPLGSVVEWSDGAPRPPDHQVATLYHWKRNNGAGLLVRKCGEDAGGLPDTWPFFILRHDDDLRTFPVGVSLRFRIAARPRIGSVRIFERDASEALLLHLAEDWEGARAWLDHHGLPGAVPMEVTADQLAADHVEGRSPA